jgi:hypothetical protein
MLELIRLQQWIARHVHSLQSCNNGGIIAFSTLFDVRLDVTMRNCPQHSAKLKAISEKTFQTRIERVPAYVESSLGQAPTSAELARFNSRHQAAL